MRNLTRLLVFAAGLMLLAVPAARACDELMGTMLDCGPKACEKAMENETCVGEGQVSMDCCVTGLEGEQPEFYLPVASDSGLVPSDTASHNPITVSREQFAALAADSSSWPEPARYALFSSYLI